MLDKAIAHGKEHRKQYRKSARHDRTCRPHGSCSYCLSNRLHRHTKARQEAEHKLKHYEEELEC